jgi:predicted DCC family thiol-disulfide oxidoreductase YuxK
MPTDALSAIKIMYDGECPACSAYVRVVRLREVAGNVEIIDLRERPDVVARLHAKGLDVNEGMAVEVGDQLFHGADAIHAMTMLSSPSLLANRINYAIFRHRAAARVLYPLLKAGRNGLLWLLGRKKISQPTERPIRAND